MKTKLIKGCTRWMDEDDIAIWKRGEGEELKKIIGVGLFNSKFEKDGDKVTVYYDEDEGDEVYLAIKRFLRDDKNFDKLCDDFVELILQKQEIQAKMMPFLSIADEIDNYPEIASEYIKHRLMRIRTSTHNESYK